jgi:hypothetical protein
VRAGNNERARQVGRWTIGALFIVFGAAVNAFYLAVGTDSYADFAQRSPFAFVRDTWASLVVPHQEFFITLLILAEAVAGSLVLAGGRMTQVGLEALMAFHVGQLAFGGVLWVWAPLMLLTLGMLLRAERRAWKVARTPAPHDGTAPRPTASAGAALSQHRAGARHVDRHP